MRDLLVGGVAPAHPALHSSEYLLNRVHLRSVLGKSDSHNPLLEEELVDGFGQMYGGIVEDEDKFGLELIVVLLVCLLQSPIQLDQEVQELDVAIHTHSEL